MSNKDKKILREMEYAIVSFSNGTLSLSRLTEKLLMSRDILIFKDQKWSHQFTQHVVTLDSASVEPPTEVEKVKIVKMAINMAIKEIKKLIQERMNSN